MQPVEASAGSILQLRNIATEARRITLF